MSSTSQPTDFSDLYTDLMQRVRVDSNQTIVATQAKRYINIALTDMHIGQGEKFPWARRDDRILTNPAYSTGTVTVAQGSASVTGTDTLWTTTNGFGVANVRAGGKIVFPGDNTVYEVESVGGAGALTLTDIYRGAALTDETYQYWEDEYALAADFLKPIDMRKFDARGEIEIMDRRVFDRLYTRTLTTGAMEACAIFDKPFASSTTPVRKVRFWRPPAEAVYIPYAYVTKYLAVTSAGVAQESLSSDSDEPIVPKYARMAIVHQALYSWYRDKKNDNRSQEALNEYNTLMTRLVMDVEVGAQRPQIVPRLGGYARASKRPYSGGGSRRGGRYTLGSSFDEGR